MGRKSLARGRGNTGAWLWLLRRSESRSPNPPDASHKFPERQPHSCTGQFNIQGRFHQQTDNSHLSNAPSLSPSRGAFDETKIIKGVSR